MDNIPLDNRSIVANEEPTIEFRPTVDSMMWAKLDKDGKLVYFNHINLDKACQVPDLYAVAVALLAKELIEACAKQVDHILCEGTGTYGDLIRNLNVEEGNDG